MTQLEFHDKFQTDEQMFVWVNEAEKKIAKLEAENEKLKEPKICNWTRENYGEFEMSPIFYTSCSNSFEFTFGGIQDNNFNFCPYCGGQIELKAQ